MPSQINEWGDQVLPGVYMIQRSTNVERTQRIVNQDGKVNLELLHLEMEELAKDIERLHKSNEEIVYYLSHKEEYNDDSEGDEGDCSMEAMLATTANEVEEEGADEVFRDALEENEGVIKRKEAELAIMRALIADQRCGCHAHAVEPPLPTAEGNTGAAIDVSVAAESEVAPQNRITL